MSIRVHPWRNEAADDRLLPRRASAKREASASRGGDVEFVLKHGQQVRFGADVDMARLRDLISLLGD